MLKSDPIDPSIQLLSHLYLPALYFPFTSIMASSTPLACRNRRIPNAGSGSRVSDLIAIWAPDPNHSTLTGLPDLGCDRLTFARSSIVSLVGRSHAVHRLLLRVDLVRSVSRISDGPGPNLSLANQFRPLISSILLLHTGLG